MLALRDILTSPLKPRDTISRAMPSYGEMGESKEHNEELLLTPLSDAQANQANQTNKPKQASPNGRASLTDEPVEGQPDTPRQGPIISYKNEKWEYKGHVWNDGLLSLQLKLASSQGEPERIREAEVHSDNPEAILELWVAIPRPVHPDDPELFEPFAILDDRKRGRRKEVLVQWVGFGADKANTTWRPETAIAQAAPGIIEEYRANRPVNRATTKSSSRVARASRVTKRPPLPPRSQRQAKRQL
ncbi:hypothetical protein NQ176_g9755 [Zarea fungicola]|uniref:Uncharacterized protein n=1 Tax=Zarea fungicola TaxID=93591 RepID=A0ACC1MKP8_9HYPO|nr:hypothetical protein NQ176_g9755 [Lecanicillium fungicola]